MKNAILTSLAICFFGGLQAQMITPEVISSSGANYSNASASMSYTLGEIAIETYSTASAMLTQGFQQGSRPYRITGHMTYNNLVSTPLNNTKVYLKTLAGVVVDSASTDATGAYYFYQVNAGTYMFRSVTSIPLGSVNSVDALLVLQHFVHLTNLTGMKKKAADVDLSGYINSIDALYIAKRFTMIVNSFPSGDWLFTNDTVTVSSFPYTHDQKAQCYGDVNASYVPAGKLEPEHSLKPEGLLPFNRLDAVEIPVVTKEAVELGSVSWVMTLPDKGLIVNDIKMKTDKGHLVFNTLEQQLRLSWYSLDPWKLAAGDTLFEIRASLSDAFLKEHQGFGFNLLEESTFSDLHADALENLSFSYPAPDFTGDVAAFWSSANYPNPFSDQTYFNLALPDDALVRIAVYDLPGKLILSTPIQTLTKGIHRLSLNGQNLSQGSYLYTIEAEMAGNLQKSGGKLVVVR